MDVSELERVDAATEAIRTIWKEWSKRLARFSGERPAMQGAFQSRLQELLPAGLTAVAEYRPRTLPARLSAWSRYDIAVLDGASPLALLELSFGDTNVPHALHNGELKLLGDCRGRGAGGGGSFAQARAMSPEDVVAVSSVLSTIAVRGLFFVNPGPRDALDVSDRAVWWETKAKGFQGETKFRSSILAPRGQATLRETFTALAEAGLRCWFYSLCGERALEFGPARPAA